MNNQQPDNGSTEKKASSRKLTAIVTVHLVVVGAFFIATFFWGNFTG